MFEFYTRFYAAVAASAAHGEFCRRVFGQDLGQHGFADVAQLDALIAAAGLGAGVRVLDLGCGDGRIAEYLSDRSGAHVTGLDYVPGAIEGARVRTASKADRLQFVVGDINALDLPATAYDVVVSIDTIYFSNDYAATIGSLHAALRPSGRLAFLYSHGREPWVPLEEFDKKTLTPDCTPLAQALAASGFVFTTQDFTADDLRLAIARQEALADLCEEFAAEGNLFLYENRLGDANGIRDACEQGLQRRYLYVAQASFPSSVYQAGWSIRASGARPVTGHEGERMLVTFLNKREEVLPSVDDVVARIAALGPNTAMYVPPQASAIDLLPHVRKEAPIAPTAADQEWAAIEASIKACDRSDDEAEGRHP
jgi:ubiquinone/menaquinone biosynthesis C-methylase UbiE